ncbi:glycosyltransferase family 87 protein [Henriciella marina]|uniref:Glycosyltransferase family 87 protein n=1 Tax=Henriciella marina TaxID=453851 RepID=A0ABT4LRB1_9PROT|nr:glycosyltransferase family 87 protein [Henriciella marina]MCZ4296783.1 glycosyltransferase family 87 protein [Henriciella marina]
MQRLFQYYAVAILCVSAIAYGVYLSAANGLVDVTGRELIGRDFVNYYSASRLVLDAAGETLMKVSEYRAYLQAQYEIALALNWSYPPHYLFFILPLGLFGYLPAYALWIGVGAVLFVAATGLGLGAQRRDWATYALFTMAAPAFLVNAAFGQNGLIAGALLFLGVSLVRHRPILAGICLGALTAKPQLGLLIPVFLLLRAHWTVIGSAVVTSATMIVLSALIFGMDLWRDYFEHVLPFQRIVAEEGTGIFLRMMPTGFALGRLAGLDASLAMLIQGPFSLLALGLVIWAFRKPSAAPDLETALLLVAVFLFSPYAFNYDMLALVPALYLVFSRETGDGPVLTRFNLVMGALLFLPLITFFAPLGPVILAAAALLLAQQIAVARGSAPAFASTPAN